MDSDFECSRLGKNPNYFPHAVKFSGTKYSRGFMLYRVSYYFSFLFRRKFRCEETKRRRFPLDCA